MLGKELSVQVFRRQTQVGLEECRPAAAILGPPPDEDPITSTMRALITRAPDTARQLPEEVLHGSV
jgi:hypothetical protein